MGGYYESKYVANAGYAFAKLRAMNAAIYQKNGKAYYPTSQDEVDALFGADQICLTLAYDPNHPGAQVAAGAWHQSTIVYVPSSGSIGNTNFVAIGFNSKSTLGALVVSNYIASMAAMYKRREIEPPGIGALQAYNPTCDAIVNGGWSVPFFDTTSYPQTPSAQELYNGFLPEINSQYDNQQQNDWFYCVQLMWPKASGPGGSGASCT